MTFVDVAVLAPLGRTLTYEAKGACAQVTPGCRVLVELGRRKILAMVLERHQRSPSGEFAIKPVLQVVDAEPILPSELLSFLREMASYYLLRPSDALQLALPSLPRDQAAKLDADASKLGTRLLPGRKVQMVSAIPNVTLPPDARLSAAAMELLLYLRSSGETPMSELRRLRSSAPQIVKRLAPLGLVSVKEKLQPRGPFFSSEVQHENRPSLTEAQTIAVTELREALLTPRSQQDATRAFLLHGVTGSGKTEVYLRAIEEAKTLRRGALLLVPEIALTPQLVARFRARFGDEVAVLHSGLHPRDRFQMWMALRQGQLHVAIGARSALFAPVLELGLILVDEEHDGSFKQEEGVRYQARDMALLRAARAGAVCVLGSATPSLEAEQLARAGRIRRLVLPARAHSSSRLPTVLTVDLRSTGPGPSGDTRLSLPLHREIERTLERQEQAILFLNRRGFAPSVVCHACGQLASCPHCSVALTLHRRGTPLLQCHYCDHSERFTGKCARCGSQEARVDGAGTERLEEVVQQAFPNARVGRLDRDVARGLEAEAILDQLRAHRIDILVGTQMVAKGHDLPNVTLVGVIHADAALSMPDFRASERSFQTLVQVSGRAGRGDKPGRVILQTRNPDHPALLFARTHDVAGFVEHELLARQELLYPPFARLALLRVDAADEGAARAFAASLAEHATHTPQARRGSVLVLGPAPAPIERLRGRFRFRVLLKAPERTELRAVLRSLQPLMEGAPRQVRALIDIDPVSMR